MPTMLPKMPAKAKPRGMEDARLGKNVEFGQMDQHARHHATGSTSGAVATVPPESILLAHGQA